MFFNIPVLILLFFLPVFFHPLGRLIFSNPIIVFIWVSLMAGCLIASLAHEDQKDYKIHPSDATGIFVAVLVFCSLYALMLLDK